MCVLLRDTNYLNQCMDIENSIELASAQRFVGMSISDTISDCIDIPTDSATKIVDIVYGHTSRIIIHRGKKKKEYTPRGLTAASIMYQINNKSKFGKSFSSKWLSSKVLPELERWGFVESSKIKNKIKTYRANGYCRRNL